MTPMRLEAAASFTPNRCHNFQSLAVGLAAFRSRLVANGFYQKRAISGEVR